MQQLKKIIKYKKIYLMQFDLHVYVHNTNSFNIVWPFVFTSTTKLLFNMIRHHILTFTIRHGKGRLGVDMTLKSRGMHGSISIIGSTGD